MDISKTTALVTLPMNKKPDDNPPNPYLVRFSMAADYSDGRQVRFQWAKPEARVRPPRRFIERWLNGEVK